MAMQPIPSTASWGTGTTTGTLYPAQPSIMQNLLGGLATGIGYGLIARKGGLVKKARGGLAAIPRRHDDAREDRAQTLDILREKKLIKARGGLAAVRKAA
jgi:hypothetical protein